MENSISQLLDGQTVALPVPKRLEIHGRSIGGGTDLHPRIRFKDNVKIDMNGPAPRQFSIHEPRIC